MNKIIFGLLFSFLVCFSTTTKAEVSPETVVDIFERLESLEKKVRELHGKNEELQHQIDQLEKKQKRGFSGINERIDGLDTKEKSSAEDTDSPKKEESRVKIIEPAADAKKPADDAKEAQKTPTTNTTASKDDNTKTANSVAIKSSTKAAPAKKSRAPSAYEKETYQAAFNKIKVSPTAATKAFQEYIKMQPKSPLAANAQYWIGEIMYSHNNYKGAVQEFIKVLQKYKYSDKAPDAAIKLGYSFYALKNWDYARRTFEDVLKYFPENKNAVNLAKKRLEKMTSAGH
jgi:tol-pal system protein YbgF